MPKLRKTAARTPLGEAKARRKSAQTSRTAAEQGRHLHDIDERQAGPWNGTIRRQAPGESRKKHAVRWLNEAEEQKKQNSHNQEMEEGKHMHLSTQKQRDHRHSQNQEAARQENLQYQEAARQKHSQNQEAARQENRQYQEAAKQKHSQNQEVAEDESQQNQNQEESQNKEGVGGRNSNYQAAAESPCGNHRRRIGPLIVHDVPPRIIFAEPHTFMSTVQRLTGSPATLRRLRAAASAVDSNANLDDGGDLELDLCISTQADQPLVDGNTRAIESGRRRPPNSSTPVAANLIYCSAAACHHGTSADCGDYDLKSDKMFVSRRSSYSGALSVGIPDPDFGDDDSSQGESNYVNGNRIAREVTDGGALHEESELDFAQSLQSYIGIHEFERASSSNVNEIGSGVISSAANGSIISAEPAADSTADSNRSIYAGPSEWNILISFTDEANLASSSQSFLAAAVSTADYLEPGDPDGVAAAGHRHTTTNHSCNQKQQDNSRSPEDQSTSTTIRESAAVAASESESIPSVAAENSGGASQFLDHISASSSRRLFGFSEHQESEELQFLLWGFCDG